MLRVMVRVIRHHVDSLGILAAAEPHITCSLAKFLPRECLRLGHGLIFEHHGILSSLKAAEQSLQLYDLACVYFYVIVYLNLFNFLF